MAKERHGQAAFVWSGYGRERTQAEAAIYAEGLADREAQIVANLRRRHRWGGGAVADRQTADEIEQGLDSDWKERNG